MRMEYADELGAAQKIKVVGVGEKTVDYSGKRVKVSM